MSKYSTIELASAIECYILISGWKLEETLVRISAGEEQERVLLYGSSRVGKSDKDWDKLHLFEPTELPRYPLRHDDVIIASTFNDLKEDAQLDDGTLAHKLQIYKDPFITFYSRSSMIELMNENADSADADTRNRGRHWLFKSDKRQAILGIADIIVADGHGLPLRQVPLSGKGIPRMDGQPRRFYFALTNLCNRSCELCSCHSDPSRSTYLSYDRFKEIINCGEPYEAQLEGGEPLVHPDFKSMVGSLIDDPLCARIILCTNAVLLPWGRTEQTENETVSQLQQWLSRFQAKPFLLKPSVNSHLIGHDSHHIEKMILLRRAFEGMTWQKGSALQFNVRRDPTTADGDRWVTVAMENAGLADISNDFLYQRIGRADELEALVRPYIVPDHVAFDLISPDGRNFGFDLVGRANHMKDML